MNTPKTDYIVAIVNDESGPGNAYIKPAGSFDLSNHSYIRMSPGSNQPMEEWVPTSELDSYKQKYGIE